MSQKDKKTEIIYTDSDIKVSRFLLDLPAKFNEEIHDLASKKEKKIFNKIKSKAKIFKVLSLKKNLIKNAGDFIKKQKLKGKEKKEVKPIFSDYKLLGEARKEKEKQSGNMEILKPARNASHNDVGGQVQDDRVGNYSDLISRTVKRVDKQDDEKKINIVKKQKTNKHHYKIKRLAFFPLFKTLYFLIKKIVIFLAQISHGMGWITVFLFRFIFILFFKIFKYILKYIFFSKKTKPKKNTIKIDNKKIQKQRLGFFDIFKFRKNKKTTINFVLDNKDNKKQFIQASKILKPSYVETSEDGQVQDDKVGIQDDKMGVQSEVGNYNEMRNKVVKSEKNKKEKLYKKFTYFILRKNEVQKPKIKNSFKFKKLAFRPTLGFLMILIIFALPFKAFTYYKDLNLLKGRVLEASEEAVLNMVEGSRGIQDKNFNEAESEFKTAEDNFLKAQDEIKNLSLFFGVLGNVIPKKEIKLAGEADNILEAGSLSARIGIDLNDLLSDFDSKDIKAEKIINSLSDKTKSLEENILKLNLIINDIDPKIIPEEYYEDFQNIQEKFSLLSGTISEFSKLIKALKIFSGFYNDERYLLVFQNNTEMRGSGGFIGSYALADLRNGEIINLEIPKGGSYDTEGGLYEKIIAPKPLHLVNPLWHFWDANWWPDWSMSAEKLMWFYEKSGGPTVDGVIAFTPTVLERMLEIIGPLDMSLEYGKIIDAHNFWEITQEIVEEKPREEKTEINSGEIKNEPKKIIGDMMHEIIYKLKDGLDKEKILSLANSLNRSLDEKHLMFYFKDSELKNIAEDYGWDGKIRDSSGDYLMVVNSNIAGAKSDKSIKEEIMHQSEVQEDGSIINTLKIKRIHNAIRGTDFIGVRNVDWLRVYVPLGSELISFKGAQKPDKYYFEDPDISWQEDEDVLLNEGQALTHPESKTKIYEEKNKTVFANWCMVDPGETIEIIIRYKLPFKMEFKTEANNFKEKIEKYFNPNIKPLIPYSILVQKQPGSLGSKFSSKLILSKNMQAVWSYPSIVETEYGGWNVEDILLTDKYYALAASLK